MNDYIVYSKETCGHSKKDAIYVCTACHGSGVVYKEVSLVTAINDLLNNNHLSALNKLIDKVHERVEELKLK
jgi:hypothetical protein